VSGQSGGPDPPGEERRPAQAAPPENPVLNSSPQLSQNHKNHKPDASRRGRPAARALKASRDFLAPRRP
jgi:hypothetical protein